MLVPMAPGDIKVVELFAGIGGFRYGLERCSIENQRQEDKGIGIEARQFEQQHNFSTDGFTCVWANEWDKYACQVYRKNFGEKELHEGDITKIIADDIPDHDLLCGGFPCQAFSIAGKRKGFEDTRGTLFFDIARILRAKRPRMLLLENVKGLLSHDRGRTFQIILQTLDELGYDLQWQVLNSKNFGVPQNRERVFIIGHLRGTSRPEIFPIRESNQISNEQDNSNERWAQAEYSTTLRGSNMKADNTFINVIDKKGKPKNKDYAATLSGGAHSGGNHSDMDLLEITKNQSQGCTIPVLTPDRINKRQNGRRFKEDGEPAFTLTGQDKHGIYNGTSIRRLTPTECERLQGFPDGWTTLGIDKKGKEVEISDSQRYKMLGNAVTTNVIHEIGKRLI